MVGLAPAPWEIRSKNRDKTGGRAIECKNCGSLDVVRNGRRESGQRYLCRECGCGFLRNGRFKRTYTDPCIISTALSLYNDGLSFEKVSRHLQEDFNHKASKVAIWKWAVKYSQLVDEMLRDLLPGSSGILEADETVVTVRGRKKWFWDAIDPMTRYVVATHISTGRDTTQAIKFMREIEKRSERPKIIITDGLQSYRDALNRVFYSRYADRRVAHDRSPGLKAGNKNKIERFHSTLKGKYHAMRGLKNAETGYALLKGFIIQYNFRRKHEALDGRTPAEVSGINLPFEDGWANLIDWATIYRARRNWPPETPDESSDDSHEKSAG